MIFPKLCRNTLLFFLSALALISTLLVQPGNCQEAEDSQVFIAGFNAYQQKDYTTTIKRMNEVLKKYPDSPLRDMTLFWLARAYYKSGNQQEAARYMSRFTKEFPDNPLKGTVEEELLVLAAQHEKGSKVRAIEVQAEAQKAAAARQAEADRQALLKKEQQRLAAARAEEERLAKAKVEEERRAAELAEQKRQAELKAEQERIAAAKAEADRIAQLKVEEESKRLELAKQEAERLAKAKAEEERRAAELAEQKRQAEQKAEQERIAAAKAEADRIAQLKVEEERKRLELARQEAERLAKAKAEEERRAAELAEQKRQAEQKAEQERIAAAKAEADRINQAKAEEERKRLELARQEEERLAQEAARQAEAERQALLKKEQERIAAAKAEQARIAREKVEAEKRAVELAEQKRQAELKTEQERIARVKAAEERKRAEEERIAAAIAVKAAEERLAAEKAAEQKRFAEKQRMREQAIAQYKLVIERFPGSKSAAVAADRLRELGIVPPAGLQPAVDQHDNTQVLKVEVAQTGSFDFRMQDAPGVYDVARRIALPFEVTNRGNGSDSFYLESGFPAEYNSGFAAQSASDKAINQTPALAPGETFRGLLTLTIPAGTIDGLRIVHPVKAASRFIGEASQSREVSIVAAAPLLRSVLKSDRQELLPGERITYRIAVLNVGSTTARNVTIRLNFPPQMEPVDYTASGFRQEMKSALVMDGVEVKSGENREYSVSFQLKDDSLAGQELIARAELVNNPLNTFSTFVSNVARVKEQRGVRINAGPGRVVVVPGQSLAVPFVITNTGNVRDSFRVSTSFKGAVETRLLLDKGRNGSRQQAGQVVSAIGPLEPREEVGVVLEIKTERNAADGAEGSVQVQLVSETSPAQTAEAVAKLAYSRPVLQMSVSGRESRLKPGEIATFELNVINRGSNLARTVELQSSWPEQLELVAAEPASSSAGRAYQWKFNELGAGEKRSIRVSFRVKAGIGVGTSIQVKNVMSYEDQLGNRY